MSLHRRPTPASFFSSIAATGTFLALAWLQNPRARSATSASTIAASTARPPTTPLFKDEPFPPAGAYEFDRVAIVLSLMHSPERQLERDRPPLPKSVWSVAWTKAQVPPAASHEIEIDPLRPLTACVRSSAPPPPHMAVPGRQVQLRTLSGQRQVRGGPAKAGTHERFSQFQSTVFVVELLWTHVSALQKNCSARLEFPLGGEYHTSAVIVPLPPHGEDRPSVGWIDLENVRVVFPGKTDWRVGFWGAGGYPPDPQQLARRGDERWTHDDRAARERRCPRPSASAAGNRGRVGTSRAPSGEPSLQRVC